MLPLQHNHQNPISAQLQTQSLSSGLQMDPTQHLQMQQAAGQGGQQGVPQGPSQSSQPPPKRRRRADGAGEDGPAPAEPRRLRRSHEACARCRSKKIKASPVGRDRRQFPSTISLLFSHFSSSSSAIRNTRDAPLARLRGRSATRRTDTARP